MTEEFYYKVDDFTISEEHMRRILPSGTDPEAFFTSLGFKVRIEKEEIVALDPIDAVYDISSLYPTLVNGWSFDAGHTNAHYWGRKAGKTATARLMEKWPGYSTQYAIYDELFIEDTDRVDISYFDVPRDIRYSEMDGEVAKAELEKLGWPVPLRHRVERGVY